jgi:hypothetical protein
MNSLLTREGAAFSGAMPISNLVLLRSLNLKLAMSKAQRLTAALLSKLMPNDPIEAALLDLFVCCLSVALGVLPLASGSQA